jgi:hypothetical protein
MRTVSTSSIMPKDMDMDLAKKFLVKLLKITDLRGKI